MSEKICGIYVIISPSNRIYIGESGDIIDRWNDYFCLACKSQIRLYRSFLKHGIENHIFQIVEECAFEDLKKKERHWQDYFNSVSYYGLNCKLTKTNEKKGILSEETKRKISLSNKGKKRSEETCKKIGESKRGFKHTKESKIKIGNKSKNRVLSKEHRRKISEANKENKYALGHKHTQESKIKMSNAQKGKIVSEKTRKKQSEFHKGNKYWVGKKHTEETKKKISDSKIGNISEEQKQKIIISNSKPISQYDRQNNFIKNWSSIQNASDTLKIHYGNIGECCRNKRKTAGGYKWKFKQNIIL